MSRYIDANEVKRQIQKATEGQNDVMKVFLNAMHRIDKIPTADVRENVRGEWLPHPIHGYREWDVCSACGVSCKRREYGIHANGKKWVTEENFPFCPNCGADMRGES